MSFLIRKNLIMKLRPCDLKHNFHWTLEDWRNMMDYKDGLVATKIGY